MMDKKRMICFWIAVCVIAGMFQMPVMATTIGEPGTVTETPPPLLEAEEMEPVPTEDAENNYGYHDIGYTAPSYKESSSIAPYSRSFLPTKFDPREQDYITEVKNQGSYGTCWAFAAMASAESSFLIKEESESSALDLSELHTAYFFYSRQTDPLGGTEGDTVKAVDGNFLNRGGNTQFTSIALANWQGAAEEDKANYGDAGNVFTNGLDKELAYDDYIHLQNVRWINMQDKDIIKKHIIEFGAGAVSYHDDNAYRSSDEKSYYNYAKTGTNHAVTIVGWDNDYDTSNFKNTPAENGAWLIKNSWGTSFADGGFFWISYEDVSIKNETAYFFDYESADNYENNYQYDGSCGITYIFCSGYTALYEANIFSAQGSETLEAVSFYVRNLNVTYEIKVYKDVQGNTNPANGTLALAQTGKADYCGYYTVPLNKSLNLEEGEQYSVLIKLQIDSPKTGENLELMVDCTSDASWIKFETQQKEGQSFISTTGSNWLDLAETGRTARIKAFTNSRIDIEYVLDGGTNHEDNPSNFSKITDKVTLMSPTKEGYKFDGWYSDEEFTKKVTELSADDSKSLTLYAKWKLITYAVSYELYDGENSEDNPMSYTIESETIELNSPSRTSYEFKGWYTNSDFKQKITEIHKGSTGEIMLYAKWDPITYKISYELNGGDNSEDNPVSYTIEDKITLQSPTKERYIFEGWYTDSNFTNKITTIPKGTIGNLSLYAKWVKKEITPVKYKITFKSNGGTKLSQSSITVTHGNVYGKLPTVVRAGFTFKGWYTKTMGGTKITASSKLATASNQTLYAQWIKVKKPVKASISGLKSSKSKEMTVKIKKVSGANGYQIMYSTSQKFKSSRITTATSLGKTIKSLAKGKTYYVKVRAYKLDSAKGKVYGSYGTAKKVKIKK